VDQNLGMRLEILFPQNRSNELSPGSDLELEGYRFAPCSIMEYKVHMKIPVSLD
jgi:hypothetical protein